MSRRARDLYCGELPELKSAEGAILADPQTARRMAQAINRRRDTSAYPDQAVRGSELHALGLIQEIFSFVIQLYAQRSEPRLLSRLQQELESTIGKEGVEGTLQRFTNEFPPAAVYLGASTSEAFLHGRTKGTTHIELQLEGLLLLWLANMNPAVASFRELFDDRGLAANSAYQRLMSEQRSFFRRRPGIGPQSQSLVDLLRSPALQVPDSLAGQLRYILENWAELLGEYAQRLLTALDLLAEETLARGVGGAGPAAPPSLTGLADEEARFSTDSDWMPKLVLLAKNAYVWLDQLAKRYGRPVGRLEQIPDEELDRIADFGFSGLWLIGVWERSPASRRIKQMCGNPEAAASAYSLYEYRIAERLGGEEALEDLRHRAWRRGIRLAADMVPNHMGIDSRWVHEHPEWFLGDEHPPFPSYSFGGPDLSSREGVGIFLEDHYYDRSDAAVVFRRRDHRSGHERFIYHGNDGTSMPWNDTAQLDYLNPQVREAVVQTIVEVARRFPVIRFDAAMTLTRKHYQRLWFPEPGAGGAIPSRAERGLSHRRFHELMPEEFWREVVDRVQAEVPDTLLLAEAFWLMEGFFVRTLGMHRVYNSAFMHMLRDQENAKFRRLLKQTLAFDPEILKRYVNFMSNPDEATAVEQFGKDDRYFGICTLMATLPGLPMFAHGQIEGFAEKYGMEFHRAYWEETADDGLMERHRREIAPLLRRRQIFAGVEHFLLYDFVQPDGSVNEDVFAFSNRCSGDSGESRNVVFFNNRYAAAHGRIRESVPRTVGGSSGRPGFSFTRSLADDLGLGWDEERYCLFRDGISDLEYVRSSRTLHHHGLEVELGAFKYMVLLDFREVQDDERRRYRGLAERLEGHGVASIEEALQQTDLAELRDRFAPLLGGDLLGRLVSADVSAAAQAQRHLAELLPEIARLWGTSVDVTNVIGRARQRLDAVAAVAPAELAPPPVQPKPDGAVGAALAEWWSRTPEERAPLYATVFLEAGAEAAGGDRLDLLERLSLEGLLAHGLNELGVEEARVWPILQVLRRGLVRSWWTAKQPPSDLASRLEGWLADGELRHLLGWNSYGGFEWIRREALERLLLWRVASAAAAWLSDAQRREGEAESAVAAWWSWSHRLNELARQAGYRIDKLRSLLSRERPDEGPNPQRSPQR